MTQNNEHHKNRCKKKAIKCFKLQAFFIHFKGMCTRRLLCAFCTRFKRSKRAQLHVDYTLQNTYIDL